MAKRYYWLKLKDDYLDSPKIKKLRKIAGGDTYTIIYLKMQLLSVKNQGVIEYEGIEQTFAEELALNLNEDPDNVKVTLSYLASQGLIEESEDSTYLLPEAIKSIGSEDQSAERVRAFRKKKALHCNADVTASNALVTACNTDIEKDRDKEIEKDNRECGQAHERKRSTTPRFIKPTVEEVRAYCQERNNSVDAERFVDYYEANGWKVGKSSMKDWKATVRNWEKNGYSNARPKDSGFASGSSLDFEAMEAYIHGSSR